MEKFRLPHNIQNYERKLFKWCFFKPYPSIIQNYLKGENSKTPEGVENAFKIEEKKFDSFNIKKNIDIPASMLLFDELGLTECSNFNLLNILILKLDEYIYEYFKHK